MKRTLFTFTITCLLLAVPAWSAPGPLAEVAVADVGVDLYPSFAGAVAWQLTVAGPDGYYSRQEVEGGALSIDARGLADGGYNWELRPIAAARVEKAERGVEASRGPVQFGYFTVVDGAVVRPDATERIVAAEPGQKGGSGVQASVGRPAIANRDQVILDDLIVDGSICAGLDCVNGESFGFDTLRLKENNLRIKFDDTSNSASFPDNDWQITANDSSNGGAEKFSIDDISGGRTPFTIEAGAPSHSLYVDDGGRIGLGTSTPVVEVHVVDGDTPTVRLEQDGSSGFTPQTWDMAGNETNFFVRDATNGSRLPLRIRPSAPSNSIFVNTNGDVGMGNSSPGAKLHVLEGGTAFSAFAGTVFLLQNNAAAGDPAIMTLLSGTTSNAQINFGDSSDEFQGRILYTMSTDNMDLRTAGATRVRIRGDGAVEINNRNTGAGAGTAACFDSAGALCACGTCG